MQTKSSTSAKYPTSSSTTKNVSPPPRRSQSQLLPLPEEGTPARTLLRYCLPEAVQTKKGEYLPLAITSSAYKELHKKYQALREEFSEEKERRVQVPLCLKLL
jgi:hypothetical protein